MDYEWFKTLFQYGFINHNYIYICGEGIYCKIPIKRKDVIFENAKITDSTIDKFLSESVSIPKAGAIVKAFSSITNKLSVEDTDLQYKGNYVFETDGIILQFYAKYIEAARYIFDIYCVDNIFEGLEDFRFHFLNCFINENCCYSLCIEEENEKEKIQMQILPALFPDTVLFKEKKFVTKSFLKEISKNKKEPKVKIYEKKGIK